MDNSDRAERLKELVRGVQAALGCAGVLVTRVTDEKQFFLANSGIRLPKKFMQSTPLSHSICQHAVAMDFPLVVDNAITHPLLLGNLAFEDLGIVAYLGTPVHHQGNAFGALCAVEPYERRWSDHDIEIVSNAAQQGDRDQLWPV